MANPGHLTILKRGVLFVTASILLALASRLPAQGMKPIQLPRPETAPGKLVINREGAGKRTPAGAREEVPPQILSNLLAAAYSSDNFAPQASWAGFKAEEVGIYVVLAKGVYRWNPAANVLEPVLEGDHRAITGSPDFVRKAPLNLVYVGDFTRMRGKPESELTRHGLNDGGSMADDVHKFCAAAGLEAVVRAWVDRDAFASAVKLPREWRVMLAQTVGHQLLAGSTVPRLPRYLTDIPQLIPAEIMIPDAPKTARRIEPFRSITPKMTMVDVVRRCGIPDELQGSGLMIFIYHLDDGSIVAIGTGGPNVLGYVDHITRSGGAHLLPAK